MLLLDLRLGLKMFSLACQLAVRMRRRTHLPLVTSGTVPPGQPFTCNVSWV